MSYQIFKKGECFDRTSFFSGRLLGREVDFFQEGEGGVQFLRNEKSHCHCFLVCVCVCVCLFRGRGYEKPIYRGITLKRRPWTACILFEKFRPETGGWMNLKNTLCTMPPLLVIRTLMP